MSVSTPSVRHPTTTRSSRLPLHQPRQSTEKSTSAPHTAVALVSRTGSSRMLASRDVSKGSGSHVGEKGNHVPGNREVQCRVPTHGQDQHRRRESDTAVTVSPAAAATGRGRHRDGVVSNDTGYTARPVNSPACGVRMSALRSAYRQRSSVSPTSSIKSSSSSTVASDRLTGTGRRGDEADVQIAKRRFESPLLYASTSSIGSTCSEPVRRVPTSSRHHTRPPTASSVTARAGVPADKLQHRTSRNSSGSHNNTESATRSSIDVSESEEVRSTRSDCIRSPALRHHAPPANQQTDKMRQRSDSCQSTPNLVNELSRGGREQRRTSAAVSHADTLSTITSVDSSSSSSSGTLTEDADVSGDESTSTMQRDVRRRRRRRGRSHFDVPGLISPALSSDYETPLLYQDCAVSGNKRHITSPNGCARLSLPSSPEAPFTETSSSKVISRRPSDNYLQEIQRVGSFGMTPQAPARVSKLVKQAPPLPQPQKCSSERIQRSVSRSNSRPTTASTGEVTGLPSGILSPPPRLPSQSTVRYGARHNENSSSVAKKSSSNISAQVNSPRALHTAAVKSRHPTPQASVGTRQTAAVLQKAAPTARLSDLSTSQTSPVSPLSVESSPTIADAKRGPSKLPPRRAAAPSSTPAVSKIPPSSRNAARQTGNGTRVHTDAAHKDNQTFATDFKVVDKSVGCTATDGSVKSPAAVRQFRSSQTETGRPSKPITGIQPPSTRSTQTQTPSPSSPRCPNDQTVVTKRPPPSKLKRPDSVHGGVTAAAADKGHHDLARNRRPASTDYSAGNSGSYQTVERLNTKSGSCAVIEKATTDRNTGRPVSKNQLTKSYDNVTLTTNNSERHDSEVTCAQMQGSATSRVAIQQPLRLVKPYSAINRSSTFARRTAIGKEDRSSNVPVVSTEAKTERLAAGSRTSLVSQSRASELSDLPEVDESQVECPLLAGGNAGRSAEDPVRADTCDGGRQLPSVEKQGNVSSSSVIQQRSTEGHKYRTEYSTFISAVPPTSDQPVVETVKVSSSTTSTVVNAVSTPATMKQDRSDEENSLALKTKLRGSCDRHELQHYKQNTENLRTDVQIEPANESLVSAARPSMLTTDIPNIDSTAPAEAEDIASADNYVITYESDNIVVLDREPVIDCLTPEADVVSTDACQRLSLPHEHVDVEPTDGGLSRTLPLSESGYDTWKSSQGSVAVAGSTHIVAQDYSAELHQQQLKDGGVLESTDPLKTFDMHIVQLSPDRNVDEKRGDFYQQAGHGQLALITAGDCLHSELTTVSCASGVAKVKDDDEYGESLHHGYVRGRLASDDVQENSACRDAQMFTSICLSAAAGAQPADRTNSKIIPLPSQLDNSESSLADRGDISVSSQTILTTDIDISSDFHPPSSSSQSRRRRHEDTQISGTTDQLTAADGETCLFPADVSTTNTAYNFEVRKEFVADLKESGRRDELASGTCLRTELERENPDPAPPRSSTDVAASVSETACSVDPYETICDDLLESMEANISDSETPCPAATSDHSAALPSRQSYNAKLSDISEEFVSMGSENIALTRSESSTADVTGVAVSTTSSPLSTTVTGRLPVMTLRRVRTNFSVVYRQRASSIDVHPTVNEEDAKAANVSSNRGQQELGTIGSRRALAVLVSRLDDQGRRRFVETTVDGQETLRMPVKSVPVEHAPAVPCAPRTAGLSAKIQSTTSSTHKLIPGHGPPVPRNDFKRHSSSHSSPVSNRDGSETVASVGGQSKLPISSGSQSVHSSVSKKPSGLRKLFSSKLTAPTRRTQSKQE